MLTLYTWLLRLLVPAVLLRLTLRGLRNRGYWQRWGERFGFVARIDAPQVIWIHAVSVGEVRATPPLVRALAARYPDRRIVLTTMTPTGSAQVKALFEDAVAHCYVPYDLPGVVDRFLERTHPQLALIMETELWPNLFHRCRARGIPVVVANARLSASSMRGYRRVAALTRRTLAQVTRLGAQSALDAERFRALGMPASRTAVTGSIKFELTLPASLFETAAALRRAWGAARPVWIAASTHEGEEATVLAAHAALRQRFPDLMLLLVPRHPERFAAVARLARQAGYRVALRSESRAGVPPDTDVFIGDSLGELLLFYAAADVAFVGGSLVATGGHNLLEPCAIGVPVVFGPHMFNFIEISALVRERRAGVQIADAAALDAAVAGYLADANLRDAAATTGKRLVEENRGALDKTLMLIDDCLPAPD